MPSFIFVFALYEKKYKDKKAYFITLSKGLTFLTRPIKRPTTEKITKNVVRLLPILIRAFFITFLSLYIILR